MLSASSAIHLRMRYVQRIIITQRALLVSLSHESAHDNLYFFRALLLANMVARWLLFIQSMVIVT